MRINNKYLLYNQHLTIYSPTLRHQGTGNQSRVPIWSSGGVAIRGSLRVLISSPSIILWEPIRAPESRVKDISRKWCKWLSASGGREDQWRFDRIAIVFSSFPKPRIR
ncbi:hypothetical protein CDAR_495711 [Caerostris darwini]|uniref:Ycf15 n=1 Tax=Caerostris darwini TaxID=1538125 RepID=A0AAV4T6E6_9ARAC|nr:hypothetical protein CDAR_495711 [Caerostris darwini]